MSIESHFPVLNNEAHDSFAEQTPNAVFVINEMTQKYCRVAGPLANKSFGRIILLLSALPHI